MPPGIGLFKVPLRHLAVLKEILLRYVYDELYNPDSSMSFRECLNYTPKSAS